MAFIDDVNAAKNQTSWTAKQRNHLRRMQKAGAVFAYYLTDSYGRPSNCNIDNLLDRKKWTVKPGIVQKVNGPLEECSKNALHATLEPHKWIGNRVWVVAFLGEVKRLDNKIAGLHREIIGEVMPEEALSPSVGVKLGRKDLNSADLRDAHLIYANLNCADLSYANLNYADLRSANLYSANLRSANLIYANLDSADLSYANLRSANLDSANLSSANLSYADLSYANLDSANLDSGNLDSADLSYADLSYANLSSANLIYADLRSANLISADLRSANWNTNFPVPSG